MKTVFMDMSYPTEALINQNEVILGDEFINEMFTLHLSYHSQDYKLLIFKKDLSIKGCKMGPDNVGRKCVRNKCGSQSESKK